MDIPRIVDGKLEPGLNLSFVCGNSVHLEDLAEVLDASRLDDDSPIHDSCVVQTLDF